MRRLNKLHKTTKKIVPTQKISGPDGFTEMVFQIYKQELVPILFILFQKIEESETLPISF